MGGVHVETEIARARTDVYAFLRDLEQQTRWNVVVVECKLASGEAGTVGARYEQAMSTGRQRVPVTAEIVAAEPPGSLTVKLTGTPVAITMTYTVEETSDGSQVRITVDAGLMTRVVGHMLSPRLAESVENLRKVLEQDAPV